MEPRNTDTTAPEPNHAPPGWKGWSDGATRYLTFDEIRSIDECCKLDDWGWIDRVPPDSRSPMEVVISERSALRALVRHYRWVVLKPGVIVKHDHTQKVEAA